VVFLVCYRICKEMVHGLVKLIDKNLGATIE